MRWGFEREAAAGSAPVERPPVGVLKAPFMYDDAPPRPSMYEAAGW
jgi:hypothetical protein